ncbi:tripartite tricarboxylate transporter permease [Salinisphaera sp. T31B1]|uniref:tripartite tricarboxylate transporter permease n=1 Tax=Salinisphaera sp. T31B1 TaxID=727963 RepID=UPI00333F81D4
MNYMPEIIGYFTDWHLLVFLPLGVLIGIVVGAIPGLTATMTIGLLLPFTFTLTPLPAFILLIGIFKGAMFGGSIAAILLGCPGTPAAACTMLEGVPMARNGRASAALDAALWSSFLGDLMSTVALLFAATYIARVAGVLGPPEFFALMLLALTIIAAISAEGVVKGIIAGCLGLLAGTVGLDLVYGSARLTFGQPELNQGLAFIPILVGLFALPDIFLHYFKTDKAVDDSSRVAAMTDDGMRKGELRMIAPTIGRSGLLGMVLGAVPGVGATISTFMAYGISRNYAPDRAEYGKGAISGVAAAESANSANGGATLIPLLTLGVPGDIVTAVLLGAFQYHGLAPGPLLFKSHMGLVYALLIAVLISSFLVFVVGKLTYRRIALIAGIRAEYLYPVIIVLAIVGSYALSNTMYNVYVLIGAGVLGLLFRRLRIPAPAFLIGFVLSPLIEDNLRRTLLISGGDVSALYASPTSIVMYALTAIIVVVTIVRRIRYVRSAGADAPEEYVAPELSESVK